MRTLVAIAILLLVLLLAALIVYILLRRSAIGIWKRMEDRRRATLNTAIERWLGSEPELLPRELDGPRRFLDRALSIEMCLGRLSEASPEHRRRILAWMKSRGMVDGWLRQLRHRSAYTRGRAAEILGTLRDRDTAPALAEALADPEFDVRMRAAKALGAVGGGRARRALVGALTDENRWSVIRISDLLAEMGPAVVTELIDAFPAMGRASRIATIDLIAHVSDSSATPFLVERLDDLDRDIRARAAAALGRIGDGRSIPVLLAALQDAEWPVRSMAAKALGDRRAVRAVAALQASLRDPEWWVRSNAADALRRIGPDGVEALLAALDAPDRFARDQALAMLESTGEIDRRLAGLVSTDPLAVGSARRLLASLVDHQSASRIRMICDRHNDPAVRAAISDAMAHTAVRPGEAR
jgi:HEAT repeat protein